MENKAASRAFLPICWIFIILSVLMVLSRSLMAGWGVDFRVLLGGNVLLFGVTAVSFYLYSKALRNNNPHVFVRMMYGSLIIKMFACIIATFVYASMVGRLVNRNGIFGCFGLYILYTWLEVRILLQMTKKSPKNV